MIEHQLYRIVRTLQGKKQTEVAEAAGVKQSSLNAFELGKASLSLNTRIKIATFLNINPLFISGESSNPFKSNDLIKFRLPESILGTIDYSIIFFIAEHNKYLNFIYFISSSPIYSKFLDKTVFAYPVISIAIKDADNNIFLINRKTRFPLVGERELIGKLSGLSKENKIRIITNHHLLLAGQEVKFKDFSITKDEVLNCFDNLDDTIITTKEENELIKYIRENNINPQDVIDYLKSKSS
jgi:transcriptional regulator with XRE-family HTH domain